MEMQLAEMMVDCLVAQSEILKDFWTVDWMDFF